MRAHKLVTLLTVLLGLFATGSAVAVTTNVDWIVATTGAWETAGNWNQGVVPSIVFESNARILNGGTAEITQTGQTTKLITLAYGSTESGNIHLISGSLESSLDQNLCRQGTASFTQEAGTTNKSGGPITLGEQSGSRGTYRLKGGTLTAPGSDIIVGYLSGATGSVEQSGGVLDIIGSSKYLYLGRSAGSVGSYVMSGGNINLTNNNFAAVGYSGVGHFTQNGGAVRLDQQFNVGKEPGGYGDYTMNSGTFLARWPVLGEKVGGTGVVTVAGGTFQAGFKFTVGQSGCGYVYQSGGTVNITNQYLYLGEVASGVGTYVLSGTGKLLLTNAANYLYVGFEGNGTFIQSNGTVNVANYLFVGKQNIATGRYRIEGGSLNVGVNMTLGESASATGTLQVVGSTATINTKAYTQNANSTLDIALDGGGVSTINVTNAASLNGELKIAANGLDYNMVATVINANAGQLSGTFSRTNFVSPLVRADVIYDTANGDLKVTHFRYNNGTLVYLR